jgi:hypothetical protein
MQIAAANLYENHLKNAVFAMVKWLLGRIIN